MQVGDELGALDLPAVGLREPAALDRDDKVRLETDLIGQPRLDSRHRACHVRRGRYEEDHELLGFGTGPGIAARGHEGHLGAGHLLDDRLDVEVQVVDALHDDQVAVPAGQCQPAVVDEAEVAAVEPAVLGVGLPVGLRIAVVAGHHRAAGELQPPHVVLGQRPVPVVDDPHPQTRQWPADLGEGDHLGGVPVLDHPQPAA